ncbi:hypothetical protein HY212_02875 [Candidatus Pacearchaeota archaeon]|nr:hypothetical protein [Candidatus Pacearchaeota archaeon]
MAIDDNLREVFLHYARVTSPDGFRSVVPIYELFPQREYELKVEELERRVDTIF